MFPRPYKILKSLIGKQQGMKILGNMKRIIFCFFLLLGTFCSLQAQDKIVLRNGRTIEVKVRRSLSERVEYTYPGETSVYERPKTAISYILYEDGRKEICDESLRTSSSSGRSSSSRSRISANDEVYWQDVKTTFSEAEVRNMKRLGRISAVSKVSYKDAINQLKKKAAAIGGTTILIMDIPENEYSDDVEVRGTAYRDENMEYTPRAETERTSTPKETSSNERRRRIAQQMERYNYGGDADNSRTDRTTTAPTSRTNTTTRKPASDRQVYDNADSPDAVYLTNGRVIRGTIEEYEPDDFVSIRTPAGKIHELSMDDVKRVSRGSSRSSGSSTAQRKPRQSNFDEEEEFDRYTNNRPARNEYDFSTSGYKGFFDLGYNIPIGGTGEKGNFEINTSHGYQINDYFFVGAGIGLHIFNARDDSMRFAQHYPQYVGAPTGTSGAFRPADSVTYMHAVDSAYMTLPIFLDVRGYLPLQNSPITPFAMFRIGYAFNLSDGFKGMGLYLNPAIGAKYQVSPMFGINLSIGYSFQSYGGVPKDGGYGYYYYKSSTEKTKGIKYEAKGAGGLSLKLGIEF
jgi:hypothetical protein